MKTVVRHSYKNGEISETRTLGFLPFSYDPTVIQSISYVISNHLTPDLLTKKYREENVTNSMFGHCYHSTQALFYLMDTNDLVPMSAEDYRGEKHWWLQNGNKIYDVTEGQYYSVHKFPPHEQGKKSKWYGWKQRPQQISLDLMVRVLGNRLISDEALTY